MNALESPLSSTPWTLTPLGHDRHKLMLWGKLPPRWLANLTGALSTAGISVQRGRAGKLSPTVWQGTFELLAPSSALRGLDFMALAQAPPPAATAAALSLDRIALSLEGDALRVELSGADSVGFLMNLLKLFAYYSLYPAEVQIETPQGRVHDIFQLKGLAGSVPTAAILQTLQKELEKSLIDGGEAVAV